MREELNSPASRSWVWSLIVIGLALRAYLIFVTPYHVPERIGELSAYNDEPAHVAYTLHVLETGKLPGAGEPITKSLHAVRPTFENYQSPLYYIVHSAACRSVGVSTERGVMLVGRLLSLICMAGLVWTAYAISRQLRMNVQQWTIALTVFALSGVFARYSTQAGNETLAWLFAGLVVLAVLRLRERTHARPLYAMAILFVLGVYAKLSLLILLPLLALALFSAAKTLPRSALIAAAFIAIGISPLLIYNAATFGSAIPLAAGFGDPAWRLPTSDTLLYLFRSSIFPWSEFWQSWLGLLLMLPALCVFAWLAYRTFFPGSSLWCSLLLSSAVLAYLWLNMRYDQAEGRYLFIAWPALLPVLRSLAFRPSGPLLIAAAFTLPYLLFVI